VSNEDQNLDERMARLGRATEAIRPRAGFSARVMGALGSERQIGWLDVVSGSSRRFLSIAALAAAVAAVWAVKSESTVDDALAASYGTVDVEW
jgi:hypothetical protein